MAQLVRFRAYLQNLRRHAQQHRALASTRLGNINPDPVAPLQTLPLLESPLQQRRRVELDPVAGFESKLADLGKETFIGAAGAALGGGSFLAGGMAAFEAAAPMAVPVGVAGLIASIAIPALMNPPTMSYTPEGGVELARRIKASLDAGGKWATGSANDPIFATFDNATGGLF